MDHESEKKSTYMYCSSASIPSSDARGPDNLMLARSLSKKQFGEKKLDEQNTSR